MGENCLLLSLTLRPKVPMHYIQATPFVAAMGLVDGLRESGCEDAGIVWPHDVVAGEKTMRFLSRGGYDDEGMFVVLELVGDGGIELGEPIARAISARISMWQASVAEGRSQAGPLAFALSEFFDMVLLMGQPVDAVYPNGRVFDCGYLAGIDVWGRATIKRPDGTELEIAPEQAGIRAQK